MNDRPDIYDTTDEPWWTDDDPTRAIRGIAFAVRPFWILIGCGLWAVL